MGVRSMVPVCVSVIMVIRVKGMLLRIGILVKTWLAMEHQEIHPKRIKGCDKHTREHCEISEPRRWQATPAGP